MKTNTLIDIAKLLDKAQRKFVEFNMSEPIPPPAESVTFALGRRNDAAQAIQTAVSRVNELIDGCPSSSDSNI